MKIARISLAFSALAFLTLAYVFFPESIDDAYITLRFSKNLILGNGLVFNLGERVEGYSNFSWMLLLAAVGKLGIPMEMAMKFLGLASGLGVLALVWKLSVNHLKSDLAISMSVILLGLSSFFAVWAVDGLETVFYTMLLTALVFTLTTDKINALLVGMIASLVALTRPEGIMFSLIAVGFLATKKNYLSGLKALALVAIFAGGYELFRIYYFGQFVANTALAKVHTNLDLVLNGLRYPLEFNADSGYLLLPAALFGAVAYWKSDLVRISIVFILAQVLFLIVSGGDFMYAYRFIIPIVPCIVLLCAAAVDTLHERANRTVAILVVIFIAASQAVLQYSNLPEKHIGWDNLSFRSSTLFDLADFLAERTDDDDWIMFSEAGIVPYYVQANFMDNRGLVSPFNSIFSRSGSIQGDYLYSVRPKYMIFTVVEAENGRIEARSMREFALLKNQGFSNYRHVRNFDVPKGGSFLNAIYYKYLPERTRRVFFSVFERINEAGH